MVVVAPNLLFGALAPVPLKDTLEIKPEGDNAAYTGRPTRPAITSQPTTASDQRLTRRIASAQPIDMERTGPLVRFALGLA